MMMMMIIIIIIINDDDDAHDHNVLCVVERFQYILHAATSPATLLNEETQTYLNQGNNCM